VCILFEYGFSTSENDYQFSKSQLATKLYTMSFYEENMMIFEWQCIIDFWFEEITAEDWFKKSDAFDQLIIKRFSSLHQSVVAGECAGWRGSPKGRLAEIIVLDQFSRNMFREQPQSFAFDGQALVLSQEAIGNASDKSLSVREKAFLYMPFMHSESTLIHQKAVELFSQPGLENNLQFEIKHKQIIDRFGRYPHRNAILGRKSSKEELEFLKQPGSSF